MSAANKEAPPAGRARGRDYVLMPLLSLLTAALVLAPGELIARRVWPAKEIDACVVDHQAAVVHGKPNCISATKAPEGPWVENRYNDCGYRGSSSCRSAKQGLRLAIVGTSTAAGHMVPERDSFGVQLTTMLGQQCRRPIELQNLALAGNTGERIVASAKEALALGPDALLLVSTSHDVESAEAGHAPVATPSSLDQFAAVVKARLNESRLFYMARVAAHSEEQSFVSSVLAKGAPSGPTPAQFAAYERRIREIAAMARAEDVPLLLLFAPSQREIVLSRAGRLDRAALPGRLEAIAADEGLVFIDAAREVSPQTAVTQLFYPVNHHMNRVGHHHLAKAVVDGRPRRADGSSTCLW